MNDKTKIITFGDEDAVFTRKAVDIMEKAVGSTYGPGGRPMRIKKQYVDPMLSTDGVTVARNIAGHGSKLEDQRVTDAAKLIYQASEKTNKTAGDGTTATVIELCSLYKSGYRQIAAGTDAMLIKRQIDNARTVITEFVKDKSVKCTEDKLLQVATTSGKDEALGQLISDLIWDIGSDGAVTIEYQNAPHVEVEKVTGYLFGAGFKHLGMQEVELVEPMVFVSQKRIATRSDIVPLLEVANRNNRQFVIVGDVSGAAMETLVFAIQNQKADGLVIPPPAFGTDGHEYFEDIATYVNARVILEGDSFSSVDESYTGSVKKARIGRDKSILFGHTTYQKNVLNQHNEVVAVDIDVAANIQKRIDSIKEQMEKQEMTPSLKETLDTRLAKLAGKVSIIKVGAATEVEREELFFRVEDAVEACKSALSSGVVAGGATTLLFASELDVEPFIKEALRMPFRLLMENAAEDAGYRINQVLNAGYGKGFNLREMTDQPIDLVENGVVDATKVVLQTVENSFSVAGGLLSAGGSISEDEDEVKDK
jgi:chaperonin GroEL